MSEKQAIMIAFDFAIGIHAQVCDDWNCKGKLAAEDTAQREMCKEHISEQNKRDLEQSYRN